MNKVLEMLEGDIGKLYMLPKVLIYPLDVLVNKDKSEMELETLSTSSNASVVSSNFPFSDSNVV